MAAITREKMNHTRNQGPVRPYPMAAVKILKGAVVMFDSGYVTNAAASATNAGCPGVANETVDNSGGSAGDLTIDVTECDVKVVGVGLVAGDLGTAAFASDNQTVSGTNAGTQPQAGKFVEITSATEGWVALSLENAS
jgi:hypothetical protein